MFQEICLVCGNHLEDDGRAYCSDSCENLDASASPSVSSASSTFSSPKLGFAMGGDVPALVPSALGSALRGFQARDRYASSSASSTSWSLMTDDEDDSLDYDYTSQPDTMDSRSSLFENNTKSGYVAYPLRPHNLSYARRPSGTNTRATVPLLHRRTSSSSSSAQGIPRSAPLHSSQEDEETFGSSSPETRDYPNREHVKTTVSAKSKRSRNRASLPAYFSLLQMSSPTSTLSPSSVHTAARPSPPTPTVTRVNCTIATVNRGVTPPSSLLFEEPPRGRREISTRRSHSRSRRRSRSHSRHPSRQPELDRLRQDSKATVKQVFDWSVSPAGGRGRAPVRRNSSPPPKMVAGIQNSASGSEGRRGRMRAEELGKHGVQSTHAPGYGSGRSGLKAREQESFGHRGAIGLHHR